MREIREKQERYEGDASRTTGTRTHHRVEMIYLGDDACSKGIEQITKFLTGAQRELRGKGRTES